MDFERNRKAEDALNIGIAKNLPKWMEDSGYDYTDYIDVWGWAMEEGKDFIFPYIVARKDLNWYNGKKIIIGMDDNNSLLWGSVVEMCYPAVQTILEVPNLFSKETLTMKLGTSEMKETFIRGGKAIPYIATNLGAFAQLAMTKGKGDWRILDALKKYYDDYTK